MKNHGWWMIIACGLPLLLLFVLPVFGARGGGTLFLFIALMFIAHLFMMSGHDHEGGEEKKENKETKHEHH